jgi:hypothetical protein
VACDSRNCVVASCNQCNGPPPSPCPGAPGACL